MKLLDSLKENNSIQVKKEVKDWKEAISVLMEPLLNNGSINQNYIDSIIRRTEEIGPFYILGPGLAMPHERGEMGALKNAFTILTLKEKVTFPTNEEVDVLIGFSSTDSDSHIGEAIPQIVMLFDDDDSIDEFRKFNTEEELINHIDKIIN